MLNATPIKMYHIDEIMKELKLSADTDDICVDLTDSAILLEEPIGMESTGGYVITPRYFTLRTIYHTLNLEILN